MSRYIQIAHRNYPVDPVEAVKAMHALPSVSDHPKLSSKVAKLPAKHKIAAPCVD